ncbi:hypothetical protein AALB_4340 [Agarivorans albus MKT 106]|uniref:Uncharacterized protein n=1 Tax=Agarivorans albus MKT 106 TaxID=1331007 RepID=R9PSI4_AGAAL|nr:hypothetical protein AALB_4340 [Agarivorans albus MKT 106]
MSKHITSKGSIALRAGRANARRCFGRYVSVNYLLQKHYQLHQDGV